MTPKATRLTAEYMRSHYDMDDPELAANWETAVTELHRGCPVAHSEVGEGYWVVNRYEEVMKVAQDWRTFTSTSGYTPNRPEGQPMWFPVECDPPQHADLREALNPYFTPKAVAAYEDDVRGHAQRLIDEFIELGKVDVMPAFCSSLPGWVFCGAFCGMPMEDLPWLQARLAGGLTGPKDKRGEEFVQAYQYFDEFLQRRRDQPPRGDVIDAINSIEFEGYDWDMRVGTVAQVVTAGLMTTGHVLASALYYLADHAEDRQRLIADPELWPRAAEEFTRAFAPSPHNGRKATADAEVGGVKVAAGEWIMLGYGAASRDPLVMANPEEVDIARSPNRHAAFGAGIHRCIGAHLARLEIRVGLQTFLDRIPDYRLRPGFTPAYEMSIVRTMVALPIEF